MLSLNKSLHAIEAAEPDVVEIYRSASPLTISPAGLAKQPCEAFLCSLTEDKAVHLYGALLLTRNKKVLVYTPHSQPKDKTSYAKALKESLAHMESLGFTMQSVNLNFSRALREVVLNDIRVLRPPQSHKKNAASPAATSPAPPEKGAVAKDSGERVAVDKRETKSHDAEKGGKEPPAAGHGPAKNQPVKERNAAREDAERLAREDAEKEQLLAEKRESEEALVEETRAMEAEKARLVAAIGEKEQLIAGMAKTLKTAGEGLSALKAEAEKLAAENGEKERLVAQLAAAEENLSAEVEGVQAEVERLAAESAEMDRLVAEKTAAEKSAAAHLATLQAERERLAAEKAGKELLAAEKAAAEKAAAEKAAAEKAAAEKAAAEKAAAEKAAAEKAAAEKAAAEKAAAEKAAAEKAAAEKAAAEKAAAEKAAAEKAAAEKTAAEKALTCDCSTDPFAFMGSEDGAGTPTLQPQSPATAFQVEKAMDCIEIADTENVIELHQSLNTSRIALEGFPTQSCSAYLCGIRKDGGVRVYIAMFLTETKKVLVYIPGKQPENKAGYTKTVQDAMDFVEIVGFMMDPVKLGNSEEQRARAIAPIPVFRRGESAT